MMIASLPALADETGCMSAIKLCDKAYQEQKALAQKTDAYAKELEKQNAKVVDELAKEKQADSKFTHNPLAMSAIGVAGGAGAVALSPIVLPIVAGIVLVAALFN
jgi:hypothetical protein